MYEAESSRGRRVEEEKEASCSKSGGGHTHSTLYLVIAHQRERLVVVVVSSVASKLTQTQFPKCLKRCNITNMAKLTTSTSGGMSPTASLAPAPPSQTAITPLPPPALSKDLESKDLESKGDNLKEVLVVSPREAIVISSTSTTNQKDNDDCDPETATQTTTTTTTILVAKTIHNEVSNCAVTSNDTSECTCGVKKGLLYEESV